MNTTNSATSTANSSALSIPYPPIDQPLKCGVTYRGTAQQPEGELEQPQIQASGITLYLDTLDKLEALHRKIEGILSIILCDSDNGIGADIEGALEAVRDFARDSIDISRPVFRQLQAAKSATARQQ